MEQERLNGRMEGRVKEGLWVEITKSKKKGFFKKSCEILLL